MDLTPASALQQHDDRQRQRQAASETALSPLPHAAQDTPTAAGAARLQQRFEQCMQHTQLSNHMLAAGAVSLQQGFVQQTQQPAPLLAAGAVSLQQGVVQQTQLPDPLLAAAGARRRAQKAASKQREREAKAQQRQQASLAAAARRQRRRSEAAAAAAAGEPQPQPAAAGEPQPQPAAAAGEPQPVAPPQPAAQGISSQDALMWSQLELSQVPLAQVQLIMQQGGMGMSVQQAQQIHWGQQQRRAAICVQQRRQQQQLASSGIAALLLPGGRTAHSRFKIPVEGLNQDSVCFISRQSPEAALVRAADLIVWDEAPMMHKHVFEAVDRTFRDIMGRPNVLFGGKVVVLGGDFRQILPVVPRGNRRQIVAASLKRSSILWPHVRVFRLHENMRVQTLRQAGDEQQAQELEDFAAFLRRVGDGTEQSYPAVGESAIRIPHVLWWSASKCG